MTVFETTPSTIGLEKAKEIDWLLVNSLGGYSSGTVTGRSTKMYHGLLVSSLEDLRRIVAIRGVREYFLIEDKKNSQQEKFPMEIFIYDEREPCSRLRHPAGADDLRVVSY